MFADSIILIVALMSLLTGPQHMAVVSCRRQQQEISTELMMKWSFITCRHHIADITGIIRDVCYLHHFHRRQIEQMLPCQHKQFPIDFWLVYLRLTLAYSEDQAWLFIATLATKM